MDKKTEALKLALEALEANQPVNYCMNNNGEKFPMMQEDPFRFERNTKAIAAIREALAEQPAQQEPVIDKSAAIRIATALGWQPPRKPWAGLTKEERDYIWHTVGNSDAHGDVDGWSGRDVMDAIEAKLREKNT